MIIIQKINFILCKMFIAYAAFRSWQHQNLVNKEQKYLIRTGIITKYHKIFLEMDENDENFVVNFIEKCLGSQEDMGDINEDIIIDSINKHRESLKKLAKL